MLQQIKNFQKAFFESIHIQPHIKWKKKLILRSDKSKITVHLMTSKVHLSKTLLTDIYVSTL